MKNENDEVKDEHEPSSDCCLWKYSINVLFSYRYEVGGGGGALNSP